MSSSFEYKLPSKHLPATEWLGCSSLRRTIPLAIVTLAWLLLSCCGGGGGPAGPSYPTPTVSGVSPNTVLVDSDQATLNVVGTGFTSSSVVEFGTQALATTFVTSTQLTAILPASMETSEGSFLINVSNPSPGGRSTTSAQLQIVGAILNIDVTGLPAGSPAAVTVIGPDGLTQTVTDSVTIPGAEGSYTVSAAKVPVAAVTYHATTTVQSITIAKGSSRTVVVDYADIVPSTTKVLDQAGMLSLTVTPDGSTITLSAESTVATSLQPGDVLASAVTTAAPNGLLVKILTVSQGGSTVSATVQPATLEETFQQATFNFTQPLNMSTMNPQSKAVLGYRVLGLSRARKAGLSVPLESTLNPCASDPETIVVPYTQSLLSNQWGQGTVTGSADLNLQATLYVCPSFNFSYKIDSFRLTSLNATASLGEYADVRVEGSGSISMDPGPIYSPYAMKFGPWPVVVGGVPILLGVTATPFVGGSANESAGFSIGLSESTQATVGLSYANGKWSTVNTFSPPSFTPDPLSLDAGVDLKAYAGVKVALVIDGILAPSVSPDAYLEFNANTGTAPWWTVTTGLEAKAGVDVTILGRSMSLYESPTFNIFSVPVAQASPPTYSLSAVSPTVSSITPNTALAGGSVLPSCVIGSTSFLDSICVTGSNFVPDSIVYLNSVPLATTFVDTNDLSAVVPAAALAVPGLFPVTVSNPDTPGAMSQAVNFTVSLTPPTVTSVSVSCNPTSIQTGQTSQCSATVTGTGSFSSAVSWSASAGTINSSGLFTAPAAVGPATITATSTQDTTKSGAATITVAPPTITSVSVLCNPTSIQSGQTSQCSATVTGTGSFSSAVSWSASAGTINSSGLFSAPATVGSATITATSTQDTTKSGTATITVTAVLYTLLHSFSGSDGICPAGIVQGSTGVIYGTAASGGAYNNGVLYQVDASRNPQVLHSFDTTNSTDGNLPVGRLVFGPDSVTLYGTTQTAGQYGAGTIFSLDTATQVFSTIHAFRGSDGAEPVDGLTLGASGTLYGTTYLGGGGVGGEVFSITPSGVFSQVYVFKGSPDGANPVAHVTLGPNGELYGTTIGGGNPSRGGGDGTIFQTDISGNESTMYSFKGGIDGSSGAYGGLLLGKDGYFYGTNLTGGAFSLGYVYRMDSAGNFVILHSFAGNGTDGASPTTPLIQGSDGYFYGLTTAGGSSGNGAVFKMDSSGSVTLLYSFPSPVGPSTAEGGLGEASVQWGWVMQGVDGNIYGTTCGGGNSGDGTLFKLSILP